MAPMGNSGARWKLIHEKSLKSKTSFQTLFKEVKLWRRSVYTCVNCRLPQPPFLSEQPFVGDDPVGELDAADVWKPYGGEDPY